MHLSWGGEGGCLSLPPIIALQGWAGSSLWDVPFKPSSPGSGTYLRWRSMLAEDSSMAVGLAMFLPTAWAKG